MSMFVGCIASHTRFRSIWSGIALRRRVIRHEAWRRGSRHGLYYRRARMPFRFSLFTAAFYGYNHNDNENNYRPNNKKLYSGEAAGWKCYLEHLLKPYGGVFLFHCDYDPKDYNFSNNFYAEFWADFRNVFSEQDSRGSIFFFRVSS